MCDTFVALPEITGDRSVIFGKNSDREPNEAQVLEYLPARSYEADEQVKCTYISIPQIRDTRPVLLSRPFWMWGAEIGANDKGVIIGNEAVWTKMPISKKGGLTGMDLLRLAIERGDTAQEAMETIIQLLADHGQGGICGFEDKKMTYHNSYIIADPQEAWVLETAGPFWAAQKVKGFYSISNGLTIGQEIDEMHPDLVEHARKKKWLKKGQDFHFARCYSDWFYTTFSASKKRRDQTYCAIRDRKEPYGIRDAFNVLRDHGSEPYSPDSHLLGNRVCAHAGNGLARKATQTTGSMVGHLTEKNSTFWATGTAAPCTSIYKPIWVLDDILPDLNPNISEIYDPDNLWWLHERLHRLINKDYFTRVNLISKEKYEIEQVLLNHVYKGTVLSKRDICKKAFELSTQKTRDWIDRIKETPIKKRSNIIHRNFWNAQNRKCKIDMFLD